MKEVNGWLGEYEIITTYKDGTVKREKVKNRITNAGLNLLRDALKGTITDIHINYFALGDSSIAIDDTQTALGNERFRTQWVSQLDAGTGKLQSTAFILDDEAVFHIKEIGIFAAGTSTKDSGTLISRILWDRNKTNLESIQFVRTDTINRG